MTRIAQPRLKGDGALAGTLVNTHSHVLYYAGVVTPGTYR